MTGAAPGSVRAWVALARPRLLLPVLGLVGLGFGWAHWDRALALRGVPELGLVLLAWTALHAGTLWLNAVLDRDDGEVLLGLSVPAPPGTAPLGHAALVLGVVLAATAAPLAGAAALGAAFLAVAYSHPALAWKAHAVAGPAVNLAGYGVLSPLAGWAAAGGAIDARTVAVLPVVLAGIGGCYLAAQAFQGAEDRARGYRTLVATRGPVVVVGTARLAFGLAWAWLLALVAVGWLPGALLLAVPGGLAVDRRLASWARDPRGGSVTDALSVGRRLAWTALAVLALAFGAHVEASLSGRPPAGLGTRAGHPPGALEAWLHRPRAAVERAPG